MNTSNRYKTIGYGVCGASERYLENTLKEFKRLCDHTVILCNNTDQDSIKLIQSYEFEIKHDNREWGMYQHKIKEDLVKGLAEHNPDWLICLDMDEVFDETLTRAKFEEYADQCDAMYVYIVNLWNDGWKRKWSFDNIRAWKWNGMTKFVNRPLHCGLAPEWAYHYGSKVPVILWHYGLKDEDKRLKKVERYEKYDPNSKFRSREYYEGLKDNTCDVLDANYIRSAIIKEVGTIKRKNMTAKKEIKYVYVKNPGGFIYDIPESQLAETLKRKGFEFVGHENENRKKMEELFCDKKEV
jgi:hypothetical protein